MYQKGVQHNPTYWNGVRHNTTYRKGVQWAWVPLTSSCKRRATSKLEIDNEIEVIDLEEEATVRVADGDLIFSSGMWNLADGMFPTAKRLVPELLDACPVKTIWAFFWKSWRYMDAYRCDFHPSIWGTQSNLLPWGSKGLDARQAILLFLVFFAHLPPNQLVSPFN